MDVNRKISRLIMTAYSDRTWDDREVQRERLLRDVVDLGVGGYCVFGGEVERTRALCREVAAAAGRPLLVASDLERGLGQQLAGGTVFPSLMAIGATRSPDLAEAVGRATAVEARSVGINVVFAPVADVASEPWNPIIGVRSFGDEPECVAALTAAFVRGCQSVGVAATAKHFPGHGDTVVDSHLALPVVSADRETLERRELVPFRAAIDGGVRAVMTGHVAFPQITGTESPATLSPRVVAGMLRSELGFDGLVVTDALLMGGVAELHEPGEAAVLAIEAGADVLLMPADVSAAVSAVSAAVASGRLSEERVDRSVARVSELAGWLESRRARSDRAVPGFALTPGALADPETEEGRCGSHPALARRVASLAVTLLTDEGVLPLDPSALSRERVTAVAFVDGDRAPDLAPLRNLLDDAVPGAALLTVDAAAGAGHAAATPEPDALALLFFFDDPAAWRGRARPPGPVIDAASRLIESHRRSIVVAFATPQLASLLPPASAFVCCYDGCIHMQRAAFDVLLGRKAPSGRLPVTVGDRFARGHSQTAG